MLHRHRDASDFIGKLINVSHALCLSRAPPWNRPPRTASEPRECVPGASRMPGASLLDLPAA